MDKRFKLDMNKLKKVNKLLNRMHKKMPYNENFQPLYDLGILRYILLDFDITKNNGNYYLMNNSNTPYMIGPPLTISGDLPDINEMLTAFTFLNNKIQQGNYRGHILKIDGVSELTGCKNPNVSRKLISKDFVFNINEQSELVGSKFRKIRNKINKFKKDVSYEIVDMKDIKTSDYADEMLKLSRDSIKNVYHNICLRKMILNFNKIRKFIYGLDGFIVMDDKEKILGFDIHHKIKYTPTVLGVIKRSSHDHVGLSSFLEQETATRMLNQYPDLKFINNASNSIGVHGDFKKNMYPIRFEKTYRYFINYKKVVK